MPCREHMAQLRQQQDQLSRLNTRVLVISFGTEYWARAWLEETGAPFPLLLDPQRSVYRAYGLERSLLRSWNIRTMWLYVRLLLSGRKWRGIRGDSAQLGGDFIVDADGIVRLAYRSHDPTDRPATQALLDALRKYQ
ncbi:MAG: SelL-related redox protein [Anaerolineae bacterium]